MKELLRKMKTEIDWVYDAEGTTKIQIDEK